MDMYIIKSAKKVFDPPEWKSSELFDTFLNLMTDDKTFSINRVCGSDFAPAVFYHNNPHIYDKEDSYHYTTFSDIVKNYNGYFDFENKKDNFILYTKKMDLYFKDCDTTSMSPYILNTAAHDKMAADYLEYILKDKLVFPYGFIENIIPFLNSFKIWGEGKKILIISPFSKSLQYQYPRRDKLFKFYTFPKFELVTYNTNITYQSKEDTKEKLGLKTNNWHEECDKMGEEISKLDFDIALLSCGSYASFLGYFIKNSLHKKSIYIGGVLNLLFSIFGERYRNSQWCNYNTEYMIDPFENEDIKKITAGRSKPNEGMNAYFGYQNKKEYNNE